MKHHWFLICTLRSLLAAVLLAGLSLGLLPATNAHSQRRARSSAQVEAQVSKAVMLQIVRAEDERRWDDGLRALLSHTSPAVRTRAALAAGRIGDERAVTDLIRLLRDDANPEVNAMAAFALGEIESASAADALMAALNERNGTRARALEALGKIAAALPKEQEARQQELAKSVLGALEHEHRKRSRPSQSTILLGLTAVLRSRPANAGPVVAEFVTYPDPRIRADAANTLARLRLKDGNAELRRLLVTDPDPNVRANAARVLGATEDAASFDGLLDRALKDTDSRVRVSAIRALASLKDARATVPLIDRATVLLSAIDPRIDRANTWPVANQANELLEIATTLGRVRQHTDDERTIRVLRQIRPVAGPAPEVEIALARVHPQAYPTQFGSGPAARDRVQEALLSNWRVASSLAQGLGELAAVPDTTKENKALRKLAEELVSAMLDYRNSDVSVKTVARVHSEYAIPDVLRAYAAFKPTDLRKVLATHLKEADVIIRGTAADLLGEMPPDESSEKALIAVLPNALQEKELNDAALSILDALSKQKTSRANDAIKLALESNDHLIQRRALALLKANGTGDFSSRISTVQTKNTTADYERAISRIGKTVTAEISTSKGTFTIKLLPEEAPLTVDNFIQLANRQYFQGIVVHRVVPNFVIQDGDPRGDGNGGPGYQIRCEINEVPYARGAVGMALSGKDTGGSQWFVTHAPQPHLDGGYTVFGNVISGMAVVDSIARGDLIASVVIKESRTR
jgi:cyclophilin family peptidyl-prolyl cis-trans isomerase/HEAT repeat protein